MEIKTAVAELKPRLKEYVESITERSKGGLYVCPLCGSGTGKNGTGAFSIDKETNRWKCFACGRSGDLFDLIGEKEGIDEPKEQIERAGQIFGVALDGKPATRKKEEKHTDNSIHTTEYTQYYRECNARLKNTDYFSKRGISEETANRFLLGYDPQYKTGGGSWRAVIIPTGRYSYVARNTATEADSHNRYRKTGNATPFNWKALEKAESPIFIVEGEIDALSIIEAGGEAIGLGSTANKDLFITKYLKDPPQVPLLVALDNDEAGEKAGGELLEALKNAGAKAYRVDIYGEHKDANEALLADAEALKEAVEKAKNIEAEELEKERKEYEKENASNRIQAFIDGIAESVNTPATPTGFEKLDEEIDGGLYEGLYIIGAITSLGKTTLALQIADNIAEAGRDVLIFSLEMAGAELISKSVSRLTLLETLENGGDTRNAKTARGITAGQRWTGYSETEKETIKHAIATYAETIANHIYIKEGLGDLGVRNIREAVERHKRILGTAPVVLVDYIQILAPYDIRATDKQNIDKAIVELKRISRDYKTPVIGISSLNRAGYSEKVTLEAFKESGAIEYGSDVLIGLNLSGADAKEKNPREVELTILKNRNGKTGGRVLFNYYPLFNYFEEA